MLGRKVVSAAKRLLIFEDQWKEHQIKDLCDRLLRDWLYVMNIS
jgi:hypothetical protein